MPRRHRLPPFLWTRKSRPQAATERHFRLAQVLLLKNGSMKTNRLKSRIQKQPTLAELILTVSQITRNEELSALIVADMINSQQVRLGGEFQGRRVVVS
jgi:hypothetical protein